MRIAIAQNHRADLVGEGLAVAIVTFGAQEGDEPQRAGEAEHKPAARRRFAKDEIDRQPGIAGQSQRDQIAPEKGAGAGPRARARLGLIMNRFTSGRHGGLTRCPDAFCAG